MTAQTGPARRPGGRAPRPAPRRAAGPARRRRPLTAAAARIVRPAVTPVLARFPTPAAAADILRRAARALAAALAAAALLTHPAAADVRPVATTPQAGQASVPPEMRPVAVPETPPTDTPPDMADAPVPLQAPPARVVSINLCTDQLAMALAAPGQLVSVSALARDPQISALAEAAAGYPANHARAEEIRLLAPDLVLAGQWDDPAMLAMLDRLGLRVERFAPAAGLAETRAQITRMGALLGRVPEAQAQVAALDARLAALAAPAGAPRPLAVIYQANGYALGPDTLAGALLALAGFRNLAGEAGLAQGGPLPLEAVVMAAPRLVVTGTRYPGPSRAEEILDHPALAALRAQGAGVTVAGRDWTCGTPFLDRALAPLAAARAALPAPGGGAP